MDGNPEQHMETDVSSTTTDVPETQEVTGSYGDVQITVEKLDDEEINSMVEEEQFELPKDITPSSSEDTVPLLEKSPAKPPSTYSDPGTPPNVKTPTKSNLSPTKSLSSTTVSTQASPKAQTSPQRVLIPIRSYCSPAKNVSSLTTNQTLHSSPQKLGTPTKSSPSPSQGSPSTIAVVQISPRPQNMKEAADSSSNIETDISEKTSKASSADADIINVENNITGSKDNVILECKSSNFLISENLDSCQTSDDSKTEPVIKTDQSGEDLTKMEELAKSQLLDTDAETSNDSHSNASEHSKNISRELKSLMNSAKESKIISECTQITSKTRKSRSGLDCSNTSLNISLDGEKSLRVHRNSTNSENSTCSEMSETVPQKRSMRSQNPEFANKVKVFLNSVTGKCNKPDLDRSQTEEKSKKVKEKTEEKDTSLNNSISSPARKKKKLDGSVKVEGKTKITTDSYCWRCHYLVEQTANEKSPPTQCTVCPRSFHFKCLTVSERNSLGSSAQMWVCPECVTILNAESSEHRSPSMKRISMGTLSELLKHALDRMLDFHGVQPFTGPVDRSAFPLYDNYVVHPMDLSLMKKNLEQGQYGSTEAFLADAQWILHNSIIFNSLKSNLTTVARGLVRLCRTEISEIEACPECYAGAYARKPTWFTDVCTTPHILLWAKLKGFPYWPAKGMSISSHGLVDVRFFGAHDRAWVPAKDCFLYSEKDPNNFKVKRQDIIDSMQEAEHHIRNISRKYGKFVYPPFKILLDPPNLNLQLKLMIPSFDGEIKMPTHLKDKHSSSPKIKKRHSTSKDSHNHESDMSDAEPEPSVKSRKMADGAEIARVEEDEKDKTMEIDTPPKPSLVTRKRRRSQFLVEAVATVMETSSTEKRRRLDIEEKMENQDEAKKEPAKETPQKAITSDKGQKIKKETPKTIITKVNIGKNVTPQTNKNSIDTPKTKNGEAKGTDEKVSEVTPKPKKITLVRLRPKPVESPKQDTPQPVKKTETPKEKANAVTKEATDKQNEKGDLNSKTPSVKEKPRDRPASRSSNSTPTSSKAPVNKKEETKPSTSNSTPTSSKTPANKKEETKKNQSTEVSSEKPKENNLKNTEKNNISTPKTSDKRNSSKSEKTSSGVKKSSTPKIKKSIADRILFDDDTCLAVLAKSSKTDNVVVNIPGMPAISDIRSLSSIEQQKSIPSTSKSAGNVVEASSNSKVFTPTSSVSVINMSDAMTKLKTLKETEPRPQVGRVGVRAFARMKSPERNTNEKDKEMVQIEIKTEPMDYDDSERLSEKLNLMNACMLQPVKVVSSTSSNLREVRIAKPTPSTSTTQSPKVIVKVTEPKTMAKKTFPQPKKVVGGSELNSKNSMVYIPIQPPVSKPPPGKNARNPPTFVVSSNTSGGASILKLPTQSNTFSTSTGNNTVNTVTTPMLPVSSQSLVSSSTYTTTVNNVVPTPTVQMPSLGPLSNAGPLVQVVGGPQVPSSVHTVPLITSVNGQWTFSLQPVMSGIPTPPLVNGIPDRNAQIIATPPGFISNLPNLNNTQMPRPPNENAPGEPPRLQQKPPLVHPLDPSYSIGSLPVPSTAGPVTSKLNQNAIKLTDFFRMLLVETLEKLEEPSSTNAVLRFHLEQAQWRQQQEIKEIQHNHGLLVAELRASFEKEKARAVAEARKAAQIELEAAVKHAKSKLWCASCSQEAQFYCCWNTAYCDLSCQKSHWPQHFTVCTQKRTQGSADSPSKEQNIAKTPVPTLTAGNKVTATPSTHKPFIVSMMDDANVKCMGTFKPSPAVSAAQLVSLNKQLMNNEENKKVVTTGGYLIIGGGTGTSPSIVSAARPKPNNNGTFFS